MWTDLPDGQCDWLSSQWGKYTGIPENELLGLRWLETVVHPDDRDRTLACWTAACADQGDYDLEYRIRRHDGEYRWFKTRGVPIRDETWEDRLLVRHVHRHRRRQADGGRAAGSRYRKNEFLATLAHELRNPLAPLRSGLQILAMTDDQTAQNPGPRNDGTSARADGPLIDDLLDISRISCNKLELRKACISLASVIESAVETARPVIDAKKQTLSLTLPPDTVYLDADLTRLAQVFSNILNNAAKYTDPGGRIELIAQSAGPELVVKVRIPESAFPPRLCPGYSPCSRRWNIAWSDHKADWASGWHSFVAWWKCMAGPWRADSAGVGQGSEFVVQLPIARGNGDGRHPQIGNHPAPPAAHLDRGR